MINLTDVILNDGKVLHTQAEISMTSLDFPMGQYPIKESSPLDLTITNEGKKTLHIKGQMQLTALAPCARCLSDVEVPLSIEFDEKFDMNLTDEQRAEALDESDFLHGYNLDVDKLVYGEALLVWPIRVLCSSDCKGLCKICGQNLNLKTCDCDRTDFDPRMAKIRDIFSNFKEV